MKKTFTLILSSFSLFTFAQQQLTNGGFETWGNASPGVSAEPTGWYSNKSGSNIAKLGPQTCFQDNSVKRSGSSSIRLETLNYFGTAVNGSASTGVINATGTNKLEGYIGTVNYSTASDIRRLAFTSTPDSIVGYYQYTPGGGSEQGKITAILHTGDYNDPETPVNSNHPDLSANKIARALFVTPTATVSTWTRFTAPFVYINATTPAYIMINMTSSNDQNTSVTGSKIWLDDISFIYNPVSVKENSFDKNVKVYSYEKTIYIDFADKNNDQSTFEIYDATGKLVASHVITNNINTTINVSDLNSGLYLYKMNHKSQGKSGKLFID